MANADHLNHALRLAEKETQSNFITTSAGPLVEDVSFLVAHRVSCRIQVGTDVNLMVKMLVDAVSNALLDKEANSLTFITADSQPWKFELEREPVQHWKCTRELVLVVKRVKDGGKMFITNGLRFRQDLEIVHGVHTICASEDKQWMQMARDALEKGGKGAPS